MCRQGDNSRSAWHQLPRTHPAQASARFPFRISPILCKELRRLTWANRNMPSGDDELETSMITRAKVGRTGRAQAQGLWESKARGHRDGGARKLIPSGGKGVATVQSAPTVVYNVRMRGWMAGAGAGQAGTMMSGGVCSAAHHPSPHPRIPQHAQCIHSHCHW